MSDCVKNVILSEAKDLKWPENESLRYALNDKKREKCFFTQSDVPNLSTWFDNINYSLIKFDIIQVWKGGFIWPMRKTG